MITNENAVIIAPQKGRREEPLPSLGILVFTSQDMDLFVRCFPHPPRRSHKIFLTNVYTGTYDSISIALVGPMLGAPQAVMVLEKLIALGVGSFIAVGWCGSLHAEVHIGDVVLPTGAISEEGTSRHYPVAVADPGPSPELFSTLRDALRKNSLKTHEGKVWSIDAPYRETVEKVLTYRRQGILAVDMEASALFTVAHYRRIRLAMALIVSDDLSTLKWIHGFREPKFHKTREALVGLTLKVICSALQQVSE
jgi:uridine phosphorylase